MDETWFAGLTLVAYAPFWDCRQMNVAVLKYFTISCAGAAFAVAIGAACVLFVRAVLPADLAGTELAVYKNEDTIDDAWDFFSKLHNHHFASMVCVCCCTSAGCLY